jgi:aldose 1-epimerase
MEFKEEFWATHENKEAMLYTVSYKNGFEVCLSNFGATLVKVKVPTKDHKIIEVNFHHANPTDYINNGGYLGAVVGRVANRIANAKFSLEGKEYSLFVNNNNRHCLHGGKDGFNKKWWDLVEEQQNGDQMKLTFEYISPDGEESFPGTLKTKVIYEISPLKIGWTFEAETDKTTIVNITNHAYWNLDGIDGALIDDQKITLDADTFMPVDDTLIPTGELIDVHAVGLNMKEPVEFGKLFSSFGDIDNNFVLNNYAPYMKEPRFAAEVYSPRTGIKMKVFTTEPCVQVYTGNFMQKITCHGKLLQKHQAFCLETQKAPNAINMEQYRDTVILKPGEKYFHKTVHIFSID